MVTWLWIARTAWAWEAIGSTWPEMPVAYSIADDLGGLDDAATVDAIQAAFATWNDVECARVRFEYLGRTALPYGTVDGANTVAALAVWTGDPAFSSGEVLTIGTGAIQEADIALNLQDFTWVLEEADGVETLDVQAGFTVEVGRLLGFGGSSAVDATLNPSLAGDPEARTLADDDLEAVCTVYPGPEVPGDVPLGAECTNTADCEEPFRCVSDAGEQYCAPVCPGGLCPATYVCLDAPSSRVCTKAGCGCATGPSPLGAVVLAMGLFALRRRE